MDEPEITQVNIEGEDLFMAKLGRTKVYGETEKKALGLLNKILNA